MQPIVAGKQPPHDVHDYQNRRIIEYNANEKVKFE